MSKEIEKAKFSCFNSENRIGDHFADVSKMVALGSGAKRPVRTIQNADPKKEIVAHGKTYFAIETQHT
jgi:DNA-damage-inducible protein D